MFSIFNLNFTIFYLAFKVTFYIYQHTEILFGVIEYQPGLQNKKARQTHFRFHSFYHVKSAGFPVFVLWRHSISFLINILLADNSILLISALLSVLASNKVMSNKGISFLSQIIRTIVKTLSLEVNITITKVCQNKSKQR